MLTFKDLKNSLKFYSKETKSIKPKNKRNYVGVELECVLPFDGASMDEDDTLLGDIARALLLGEFVKAGLGKNVRVGYDSSINVDYDEIGVEIRIIDTEKNIFETVQKVCKILSSLGATVDQSCGLHIHLDMRHKNEDDLRRIYNNFMKSQDFLIKQVAPHRHGNEFCEELTERIDEYRDYMRDKNNQIMYKNGLPMYEVKGGVDRTWDTDKRGDHHAGLNMVQAYKEQKTFEIRFHEATLNHKKINKWIAILLQISKVKTLTTKITSKNAKELLRLDENKGATNVGTQQSQSPNQATR